MQSSPLTKREVADLVSPRERIYFALVVVSSLVIYGLAGSMLLGILSAGGEAIASATVFLVYVPILLLFYVLSHAYALGRLRGNGIRVSERQFPAIHAIVLDYARLIGLEKVPPVYIVQQGGVLNAFATRFFGRNFVILYSDMVALAEQQDTGALGFVIGHELGHVRRGHLRFRWLTLPGRLVPYLGAAWSRACEYTCDRIGARCEPDHAVAGLLVLAAGRSLYSQVDASIFAEQVETEKGFWVRRAELVSTHPILPKRVAALLASGAVAPRVLGQMPPLARSA